MPRLAKPKIYEYYKCRFIGSDKPSEYGTYRPFVCSGVYNALLVSENHRRTRGVYREGGPFYCVKNSVLHRNELVLPLEYFGQDRGNISMLGVSPYPLKPQFPPSIAAWSTVQEDLNGLYATGYKRARPGNPLASVGQFLVELRDLPAIPLKNMFKKGTFTKLAQGRLSSHSGLGTKKVPFRDVPRVLRDNLQDFRSLGGEYLNVVFGWKPFVSDLQKMYHLWQTIDAQMAKIIRENGKDIRRRVTISKETETDPQTQTFSSVAYVGVNGAYDNIFGTFDWNTHQETGAGGRTITTSSRVMKSKAWFVGSFNYYIPDVGSSAWDKRARLALFGALPTPELLWEVLPWSWLIDWFSNVGDVVSNMSPNAVDNLVTKYSFVMKRTTVETETRVHVYHRAVDTKAGGWWYAKWPAVDHTFISTQKVEVKSRVGGGNPFGLNVKLESLTAGQLGILAALGLSRSSVK